MVGANGNQFGIEIACDKHALGTEQATRMVCVIALVELLDD